jgi:hypothetical protein
MKSRPILYSAPMVRALLEGRKTQTRRVVKHRHPFEVDDGIIDSGDAKWPYFPEYVYGEPGVIPMRCPYGTRGDRLWVKETHAVVMPSKSGKLEYDGARLIEDTEHGTPVEVWYRADGELGVMSTMFDDGPRWRPSIHMRREYSRLTLEVTDVRVERVQDISNTDAIAEGLIPVDGPNGKQMWAYSETTGGYFADPRVAFHMLWHSINGAESWAANPWVWCVGFKVVTP